MSRGVLDVLSHVTWTADINCLDCGTHFQRHFTEPILGVAPYDPPPAFIIDASIDWPECCRNMFELVEPVFATTIVTEPYQVIVPVPNVPVTPSDADVDMWLQEHGDLPLMSLGDFNRASMGPAPSGSSAGQALPAVQPQLPQPETTPEE